MNTYYLIAGIFLVITGFVHMVLGELWLFRKLDPGKLQTHYSGTVTKTTLRWFWHFGSFMVLLVAATTLIMALNDGVVPAEGFMGKFLAVIYLGLNSLLILLNLSKPAQLKEYPQLIIMIVIMVLLYLGSEQPMI